MTIVNGYTTLVEAKSRQGIRRTSDDPLIETIITAVSRLIDDYCQRRFYASTQTRYYTPTNSRCLLVDDLLSVTTLATDSDYDGTYDLTWSTTDYNLLPSNNALEGWPYWKIEVSVLPTSNLLWFPRYTNSVKIVGSWGFSATTPALIAEACLAQVVLFMRAPDVALQESGAGPMLQQLHGVGLHPFVRRMLDPFCRGIAG